MAHSYDDIRESWERIKQYFTNDLTLLSGSETGGSYITAFLIACACETLSRFTYGKGDGARFFSKMMLPAKWQKVGSSLFDAMRNGIGHRYETKFIAVGSKKIDIYISWRQSPHLQLSADKGKVYLNVKHMADQMITILVDVDQALKNDPALRTEFAKTLNDPWVENMVGAEKDSWATLLQSEAIE